LRGPVRWALAVSGSKQTEELAAGAAVKSAPPLRTGMWEKQMTAKLTMVDRLLALMLHFFYSIKCRQA
jgi:hypothetical protein